MSNVKALTLLVTTVALAHAIGCGGGKPEPAVSTPPATDTPPPAEASSSSPAATAPATEPTATATATAEPSPQPPPKPGVVIGETKDECTPVGVDFEKRARPKLKECYAAGKKKNPSLEGTVKIKVTVDVKGKIKSTKIIEKTLPDPVAECMLKVLKTTPFPDVDKCWDATLTVPITFPTPK